MPAPQSPGECAQMSNPEDEFRTAMRLLEPKIAEFQARARAAAVQYPPDHPVLRSVQQNLAMLRQEWERVRDQLKALES